MVGKREIGARLLGTGRPGSETFFSDAIPILDVFDACRLVARARAPGSPGFNYLDNGRGTKLAMYSLCLVRALAMICQFCTWTSPSSRSRLVV